MSRVLQCAVLLCALAGCATTDETPPPSPKPLSRIDISVEDADLREVLAAISSKVIHTILLEEGVHETVTISLHDIAWRDAVDVLAKMTKCTIEERGTTLVLYQPPLVTIQDGDWSTARTVLQLLGAYSGKRVFFENDANGPGPTFEIRDMRWDAAFTRIVKEAKLHCARVGKDTILVSAEPIEQGTSQLDDRQ